MVDISLTGIEKKVDSLVTGWLVGAPYSRGITFTTMKFSDLDHIEVIMSLEEHFNIEIPDSEFIGLFTPQRMIAYIYEELNI
jgi:acyl carrier protein